MFYKQLLDETKSEFRQALLIGIAASLREPLIANAVRDLDV